MKKRVLERAPEAKEFAPFPADGSAATLNPPPFRWLTHDGVALWRVRLAGPDGRTQTFGPQVDPILALPRRLAPGTWRWSYEGLDAAGRVIGRGRTRTFTVAAGLPGIEVPTAAELLRRLRNRPRRILAGCIADARRRYRQNPRAPEFRALAAWCRLAEREPLYPEPDGYRPFRADTEEHNADWKRIYSAGKCGSAHAARFALSFLLTGNRRHLELAKRWALHLVSWNPFGATSATTTDEASMPMLERLSWVYDWLRPHWTEDERRRYCACLQARGQEVMLKYRRIDFAAKPFNNHMCRQLGFLGAAGIAFLGEIPEAESWTDYVLSVLAVSYPGASWGSDDGGWANGLSYWAAYMSFLYAFITITSELGMDLMALPYYRNTGCFAAYHLPPYAPRGGFGDHAEGGPGISHKLVVGAFGRAAGDPMLRAYADAIRVPQVSPAQRLKDPQQPCLAQRWDAFLLTDVLDLLLAPRRTVRAKADLRQLPAARLFPNIGWASMHTAIGDAKKDAWLEFKSGPYGSISHSHADQNAFNLYAHGRPLLLDSGYYPWYGSPHDTLWTRQTWAHNAVLVGGRGQPPLDWLARGRIVNFGNLGPFAYARGEAAEAYNRAASRTALDIAGRNAPALQKRMGPCTKILRASRSVLMVRAKQPFFVVLDWIETQDPVRFQWLAHAATRMQVQATAPGFTVRNDPAWLVARFVAPPRLRFSQTNRFLGPAPEGRAKGAPDQWHLTAETSGKSRFCRFLTVLIPGRKGEKPPRIETLRLEQGTVGVKVGECVVLAPAAGVTGEIRYNGSTTRAALLALCGQARFVAEAVSGT